jgi:glycosyltransferase involved in cell wall biosynthesis
LTLEAHKTALSLFQVVTDLEPYSDSAPVHLLATMLPRDRFRVTVGVFGPAIGPRFEELRGAGIEVLSLPLRHIFDLNGARRLRQAVAETAPVVLHAWGPIAARLVRLIVSRRGDGSNFPRLVISGAAIPGSGVGGWIAARQVRRADRVTPATRMEGERYRQLGVTSERLTLICPTSVAPGPSASREELCKRYDIPSTSVIFVAGGQSQRGIGLKDAIVAFDMLRYDNPKLHLLLFNSKAEAVALERFGRALAFDDFRVRFATSMLDRSAVVANSYAVVITQTRGGVEEALEAMAAGKPIVGWNTPELAEIVDDWITGYLVPVGDRTALAAKMRKLLDEPKLALQMGKAGQSRASARFSSNRMIEQYTRLYMELASCNC